MSQPLRIILIVLMLVASVLVWMEIKAQTEMTEIPAQFEAEGGV